eukprot:scaffold124542_cov16-Prasinocladus_malaysianus.AAC.1
MEITMSVTSCLALHAGAQGVSYRYKLAFRQCLIAIARDRVCVPCVSDVGPSGAAEGVILPGRRRRVFSFSQRREKVSGL